MSLECLDRRSAGQTDKRACGYALDSASREPVADMRHSAYWNNLERGWARNPKLYVRHHTGKAALQRSGPYPYRTILRAGEKPYHCLRSGVRAEWPAFGSRRPRAFIHVEIRSRIAMSSDTSSTSRQLAQLSRKRAALEQLLLLARQLSRMQGGMGMLQQMLKPSQAPGRGVSAIERLCAALEPRTSQQLRQQLAALDQLIARELSSVVVLSRLTQAEFIQRYCESKGAADAAALLEKQLDDFRHNGQLNVAVRYVLHGRGIQLKAAQLPISQEAVAQRVAALRTEEQQCRQQLQRQAHELLADIAALLANPECAPADRELHKTTQRSIEHTLQMLETGGDLEELPPTLDAALPPDTRALPRRAAAPATMAIAQPVPVSAPPEMAEAAARPLGFWKKFQLWLDTPWRTRWKDIDRRS